MKRIFTFVYALLILTFAASSTLLAGNVITYTATEKLPETTEERTEGLHTNAFNVAITSHEFSNGTGTITFAGEVTTIGNRAFYICELTSIEIPSSVTTIGDYVFAYSGLTSITIPESVTAIGEGAFETCSKMTSITIPNSVKTIGNSALQGCSGLTSIEIPSSITTISNGIFRSCTGLKSVTIPNTITTIGENAFWNCNGLTSIKIPNSVKTIGEYAFRSCTSLTSINIPDAVTTIEEGTFYICSSLPSITIPNTVKTIEKYAFYSCSKLASITIPSSVTSIGDGIFRFCSGLTSIEISNSVETIGSEAFLNCTSLTSITIPSSVTTIGGSALKGCTGLTSITCEAVTPPSCGEYCFSSVNESIPVYVPFGSVDAYKAANEWKDFTNIKADSKDTFLDRITLSINKDTLYQNKEFKYNGTVTANYVNGGTNDVTESATFTGYNMATLGNQVVTVSYTEGEITKTAQYTLTVKAIPAAKYVPVAWNKIESGSKYFITAENEEEYYFAAKAFAVGKAPAIVFEASFAPETDMWVFTKNEDDTWKISTTDGADLYITNTNNGLVCAANQGSDFTVAQGTSAEFTDLTASDGVNTRYIALYNKNDFRCYKTSGTYGIRNMKLYGLKKESPLAAPVITPSVVAETYWDPVKVGLSCATEGATIYYSIDGSAPSIKYTDSITISATTTVKAIAKKQGLDDSNVVSKTFTFGEIYANLAELVNAGEPTQEGRTVKVTLTNEEILSFESTYGIMLQATKEKQIEVYCPNRPTDWEVGGKVSGILICPWHKYNDTWELSPASWDDLTYTPAVTKSVITYTATEKLPEVTGSWSAGLHTDAFNVAIASHTFSNGTGTITFEGEVTTIGERAFSHCEGLSSVAIPNSVTKIERYAFAICSGLTSVTIPNSVTTIGEFAFTDCTGLTSITCEAVTPPSCEQNCFSGVNTSIPLYVPEGSENAYKKANGWKDFTNIQAIGGSEPPVTDFYLVGWINGAAYGIEDDIDNFGDYHFVNGKVKATFNETSFVQVKDNNKQTYGTATYVAPAAKGASTVISATGNEKMGVEGGIEYEYTLTIAEDGTMTLSYAPSSPVIEELTENFFVNLEDAESVDNETTSIHVSDGTLTMTTNAGAWEAGEVRIPFNGKIKPSDFKGITGSVKAATPNNYTELVAYVIDTDGNRWYQDGESMSAGNMTNWTTFSHTKVPFVPLWHEGEVAWSKVELVAFGFICMCGEGLTNYRCDIKDIQILVGSNDPGDHSVITYTATSKLDETTTSYESGLHTNAFDVAITSHNFANGTGTITFAGKVTTFGPWAFAECSGLTSVTIPNSVTTIGNMAFYRCSNLTSITIPNTIKKIGDGAFRECTGLTSINIPDSVTTIGASAFDGCSGLISVMIGNSVTTIESYAFSSCSGLTSITCLATTPPSCGEGCFQGVNKTIPVYVPKGSISAYKAANGWKEFTNFVGDNSVYITDAKLSFGKEYIASSGVLYYCIEATDYVVFLWAKASNPYGNFKDVFDFANSAIRIYQNGIKQKELRFNKADEFEVHQNGNTMYLTANVTDTEGTQYVISASGYSGTLAYDATSPFTASFDYEDISDISMKDGTCSIIVQSEKQYLELEVYTNPSNSKLPAGTYTISDSKTPGTVLKSVGFDSRNFSRSYAATISADGQYIETPWYLVEGTVKIDYTANDQIMITVNAYNTSHQSVNIAVNVSNTCQINTSAKHGYVEGAGFYEMGSVALLIAYPDKGYKFVRWSDETIYNPYYFVVDGNKDIEAIFERVTDDLQDIYQPSPVNKIMKDGVIYIQINGNLYDVFGRQIL